MYDWTCLCDNRTRRLHTHASFGNKFYVCSYPRKLNLPKISMSTVAFNLKAVIATQPVQRSQSK